MRRGMAAASLALALAGAATAQEGPGGERIARQAEAMKPLAWMDGQWRGTAWAAGPTGRIDLLHTERVGPMLAGSVKVIEGKSYTPDGKTDGGFNAMAVLSYNPDTRAYAMRSYAQGRAGDFPLTLTPDGWTWATGPVRYATVFKDGVWTERGDYTPPEGGASRQVFFMELRKVGTTGWPAEGEVGAR